MAGGARESDESWHYRMNRFQCAGSRLLPSSLKRFLEWYSKLIPGSAWMHAPLPLEDAREAYDFER